jgi:DNA invertase Pin-like site-specific DNA recombinase
VGQPAAIYCRISKARDEDQTGVDRQERLCREVAERLGLVIARSAVFVDNNRSAWQRNRNRPGWNALLEVIRAGGVGHVIVYHPDRLMRQPRDLEELLTLSEEDDITLHGQANRRDLSDPDDRFFLRIEVAHACRSSDDTSRRLRDALEDRAREGRPHSSGQRPYGYAGDAVTIIEQEAVIVREVYARSLEGASPGQVARELNERGEVTVSGKPWQPYAVRSVLSSRHVTGIRVFRGQEVGEGDWPPIIDRGTWREVQERRSYRSLAHDRRGWRFYLLRGLVVCKKCGWRMAGSTSKAASYMCARHTYLGPERCHRRIGAARLEEFCQPCLGSLISIIVVLSPPCERSGIKATLAIAPSERNVE